MLTFANLDLLKARLECIRDTTFGCQEYVVPAHSRDEIEAIGRRGVYTLTYEVPDLNYPTLANIALSAMVALGHDHAGRAGIQTVRPMSIRVVNVPDEPLQLSIVFTGNVV